MGLPKSTKYRRELCLKIERRGLKMVYKCAACRKSGSDCVVSSDSKGCSSCVRKTIACDWRPFSEKDFEKVERERARLQEKASAGRALMRDAMAQIETAERLQRFLDKRESELVRRGLENVEELEKLEKEEELAKERAASSSLSEDPVVDWSSSEFVGFDEFLAQELAPVAGGSPQGHPGNP